MHSPSIRSLRSTVSIALATALVTLHGCAPAGPDLSTAFVNLRMSPDVTQQEGEATIAVTELVNVQLPVQAGTGYTWELAAPLGSDSPVAFAQSSSESEGAAENITVGGRTWYTVSLVGTKPGNATVTFVYRRPWEDSSQAAKTYRVAIMVTKAPDA